METLMLLIDSAALILVVYFSWKNDALPTGAPEVGPFRLTPLRDDPKRPPPPAPAVIRRKRQP